MLHPQALARSTWCQPEPPARRRHARGEEPAFLLSSLRSLCLCVKRFFLQASAIPLVVFVFGFTTGCRAEQPKAQSSNPQSASAPADAAPLANTTAGFEGARAYQHVSNLVAIGPRPAGSAAIRRAQDYIRSQLQSFGCTVEEDNFTANVASGPVVMKNLIAKIPGASPDVLLLATHYDTRPMPNFVGADDGGSSTGIMLELARHLCPRKGVLAVWIVFFDGEEAFVEWSHTDGTYGSRQMAARLAASSELKRIRAMLLADLCGGRDARFKRETSSTRWLTDLVWSTADRLGYSTTFVSAETAIEDDHLPFLNRGVSATDVIDLERPYWHTTADTLDKVSPRTLAIVGHVFLESIPALEKKFQSVPQWSSK